MIKKHRLLNQAERTRLSSYIQLRETDLNRKLNWKAIVLLSMLTIASATHIYYYYKSNWSLISKLLVCVCPIIIWVIVEQKFKGRKRETAALQHLKAIARKETVDIFEIKARNILEFTEIDDEGLIFLIEDIDGQCIYLHDHLHSIGNESGFPCESFEVYIDMPFSEAIERQINCTGNKIDAIKVSRSESLAYFTQKGFPENLQIEQQGINLIMNDLKHINQ